MTLNCNGKLVRLTTPVVMGVINLTQDSFYGGNSLNNREAIINKCGEMLREGVTFIDLGAQSTRPGSARIEAGEEINKLVPAINDILKEYPEALISIDTYYSEVAKIAIAAGAVLINDISGGEMDKKMIATVASLNVPYICMHMRGEPQTMQLLAGSGDIVNEVLDFFIQKKSECIAAGIKDVIFDPGFGFGKNIYENFLLLHSLDLFKIVECPILAGLSRKSTIYKTLKITADEAQNGTTVLNTIALIKGASILRVHDVKEAHETIVLWQSYMDAQTK